MKLPNRTILAELQIPSHAWDEQFAWVAGYILALEDILGDLDKEFEYQPTGGSTSQLDYRAGHELAVIRIRMEVNETLEQARTTLAAMKEMEDEAVAGDLRGSTPARGSSEATDPEDQGRVSDPGAV